MYPCLSQASKDGIRLRFQIFIEIVLNNALNKRKIPSFKSRYSSTWMAAILPLGDIKLRKTEYRRVLFWKRVAQISSGERSPLPPPQLTRVLESFYRISMSSITNDVCLPLRIPGDMHVLWRLWAIMRVALKEDPCFWSRTWISQSELTIFNGITEHTSEICGGRNLSYFSTSLEWDSWGGWWEGSGGWEEGMRHCIKNLA